jgi:hypothetical protein
MDQIEFYDRYRQYSTVDLINIVREKESYQAAAVLAAERLLAEREVSSVDEEEADQYFREKEAKRVVAAARVDSYKATVADWVEPIAQPSAELQPYKWFRIFLVVYGFWYARDLYYVVRFFITARSIGLSLEDFVFIGATLALDTFFFVLIIQKRKWGWILLVVEHTYMIFVNLALFVEVLQIKMIHFNAARNLSWALFNLAMVAFLWRRPMAEFFGVEPVVKKRALGVGLGLGVIFACIYFGFNKYYL